VETNPKAKPDASRIENALFVAADVIFRLWLSDSLDPDDSRIR
jgi:hypothetical protein